MNSIGIDFILDPHLLPHTQRARDNKYATYLLVPEAAERYLWGGLAISAEITQHGSDGFYWGDERVPTDRYQAWLVVDIVADSLRGLANLVQSQRERLLSGLYPSFVWAPGYDKDGE